MVQILKKNKLFLVIWASLLLVGLLLLPFVNKGDIILFFSEIRGNGLNLFFIIMSDIVEPWMFFVFAIFYFFKDYRNSIMIGLAGVLSLIFSISLKKLFSIPRPTIFFKDNNLVEAMQGIANYTPESGLTSFPSGHATAAFAVFFVIAYTWNKSWIKFVACMLAVMTGLSRIYLMNHFLVDILAGSTLGIIIGICTIWIVEKFNFPTWKPFSERKVKA